MPDQVIRTIEMSAHVLYEKLFSTSVETVRLANPSPPLSTTYPRFLPRPNLSAPPIEDLRGNTPPPRKPAATSPAASPPPTVTPHAKILTLQADRPARADLPLPNLRNKTRRRPGFFVAY
ncbi:hypothetical protein EPUS_08245 [Endocarpon pusillum Z07020]|uniref:Uncharacterized protein n=1 Tax=Endocarpon pusillum (strain Z07020 / HMAS-L-300199) TaxID=1263415 RepID=U1GVB1_ENDPU|nr:uncharacterized protein EPUS_08245 [Endocarpon pusillum Z07020]ERF75991.1 hypothetical protein EPUS_08245 [Endocarpon pusillum Z07020]